MAASALVSVANNAGSVSFSPANDTREANGCYESH